MSKVIFDVGANFGQTFIDHARHGYHVYAFEPTPYLISEIKKWSCDIPTYHLIEYAVSETEGIMKFNIAGQSDWGCSSLLEFSDGLDKTWPGRSDLKVTDTINVNTIRLDTFLKDHPEIEKIDYLHIDTQGSDLSVLRSLGDKIQIVEEGIVEVPQSVEVVLYKKQHTKEEMIAFLYSNGFEIVGVTSQMNEDNLRFRKRKK